MPDRDPTLVMITPFIAFLIPCPREVNLIFSFCMQDIFLVAVFQNI
jgi:hypothetical protein